MSAGRAANPQAVGKVIGAWRRRRKLTRKELAARTGLTPGAISGFERGENVPSLAARKRICAALDVELRAFKAEAARAEGGEEVRAPKPRPETPSIEEIAESWDFLANFLKPFFLKAAEWGLRQEEGRARPKGSKP